MSIKHKLYLCQALLISLQCSIIFNQSATLLRKPLIMRMTEMQFAYHICIYTRKIWHLQVTSCLLLTLKQVACSQLKEIFPNKKKRLIFQIIIYAFRSIARFFNYMLSKVLTAFKCNRLYCVPMSKINFIIYLHGMLCLIQIEKNLKFSKSFHRLINST